MWNTAGSTLFSTNNVNQPKPTKTVSFSKATICFNWYITIYWIKPTKTNQFNVETTNQPKPKRTCPQVWLSLNVEANKCGILYCDTWQKPTKTNQTNQTKHNRSNLANLNKSNHLIIHSPWLPENYSSSFRCGLHHMNWGGQHAWPF